MRMKGHYGSQLVINAQSPGGVLSWKRQARTCTAPSHTLHTLVPGPGRVNDQPWTEGVLLAGDSGPTGNQAALSLSGWTGLGGGRGCLSTHSALPIPSHSQ